MGAVTSRPMLMEQYVLMLVCCLATASHSPAEHCLKPKVHKTSTHGTLTGPLPLLLTTALSTAPPPWVPSIFLGRRTKAKQPAPHRAVSHRLALAAPLPLARPRDSSIVRKGTVVKRERARNGRMKTWKKRAAKDNKRKEWLRRIEMASEENSAEKKRKIVCEVETRKLRKREWFWIINEEWRVNNGFPQCSGHSASLIGKEISATDQQIILTDYILPDRWIMPFVNRNTQQITRLSLMCLVWYTVPHN